MEVKPPISKIHLPIWSFILAIFFTYTGVEVSLWKALQHPIFQVILFKNFLQIYLLIGSLYYFHFKKDFSFLKSSAISLGIFYSIELFQFLVFDNDPEEITELISIVLPFGSLCVLAFSYYYHLLKKQRSLRELKATPVKGDEIWLESAQGKRKIFPEEILLAKLDDNSFIRLYLKSDESFIAFHSLKQLEEKLNYPEHFFRLNKQFLAQHSGIKKYASKSDGRIEVILEEDLATFVSKNKAAAFKKWLEEN